MRTALLTLAAALAALSVHAADPAHDAPAKAGAKPPPPYSEQIMAGDTLYVAGHIGVDPATGKVPADAAAETRLVMDAIKQNVEDAGLAMDDVVSVTVYCSDLDLYDKFNSAYRGYFRGHFPTRAFIGVAKLLAGAHFEVSAIAVRPQGVRKLGSGG
ncbi:MAG TPA: RidA family protein [Steroidobacteraceae bacterium]|jgi:2-iminobutanoate/2-iminopropanoate deaminase|nr:RidA family protein [Steroidobacteraceae bacterium]